MELYCAGIGDVPSLAPSRQWRWGARDERGHALTVIFIACHHDFLQEEAALTVVC